MKPFAKGTNAIAETLADLTSKVNSLLGHQASKIYAFWLTAAAEMAAGVT